MQEGRPGALDPPRAQNYGVWWLASMGPGPPGSLLWCCPLAMQAQRTLFMAQWPLFHVLLLPCNSTRYPSACAYTT